MMFRVICLELALLAQIQTPQPITPLGEGYGKIRFDEAPPEIRTIAKTWPRGKLKYVAARIAQPSFELQLKAAERTANITLAPKARIGVAAEYAAAEYEINAGSYQVMPLESQQSKVFQEFFSSSLTSSADDPPTSPDTGYTGFNFQLRRSGMSVFVRAAAKYGRLKIDLKPPTDTFTVTVDKDTYDSEDAIILLTGTYDVIVDRQDDKCKGQVTIQESRTSMFACR